MEPSYKTIADLFAAPQLAEIDADSIVAKRTGSTAEESDLLGKQSLNDGDIESAIKHFRKAVEQRDADDIRSRIDLAGALDYADQMPQAFRQYEKALQIKEDATEARIGLSDVFRRYGRFQDAVDELEKAISLEPSNAFLHLKLAETLREAGYPKRALTAAQGAVVAKPDEAFYHFWIGDLLIQMRLYDEALESFQAAIELSPGDDYLYERTAIAFWGAGRHPEAIKALRLASDLDPAKNLYHGLLFEFLFEMGLKEEAKLEQPRAHQMDPYDQERVRRMMVECGLEEA